MRDKGLMQKKVAKIANMMQKFEDIASNEIKDHDDALLVAGAMLAVTRNLYVSALGVHDTAKMFEAVADSFVITEKFIQQFKPTIH